VGSLRGRAALVTGAGKRIGREIVLTLADAGVDCLVHYNRSGAEGAAVIDACRARGVRAEGVAADLSDPTALRRLADEAHAFGVAIFVHNASTFTRLPFLENDAAAHGEMLARDLAIHVTAPYLLGRMLGEHMIERQWGRIVLIGDWRADAAVYRHYAPYIVSKAAVPTLAKVLALELGSRAPGVTANAVLPGPILPPEGHDIADVEMVKKQTITGSWVGAEEVARAVVFLASSEKITGAALPVDGGRSIKAL
jgi:NAD(P)-dependent dehydrogenase (short-subunit alcohol dehydrogenase family)